VHGLLELRNIYGTLLASNGDGTTHDARIAFTASSTGTFTTGASQVTASDAPEEMPCYHSHGTFGPPGA
jgi:hypothetical protein